MQLLEKLSINYEFSNSRISQSLVAIYPPDYYVGVISNSNLCFIFRTENELIKGRYNIKHYQVGSVLLAVLTLNAFFAMAVTYVNHGKIFFGSHLIVGLTVVSLIVTSASLSPFMQRGNVWARNLHFTINIGVLGLFGWQAITGVQVVQKIISQL
jgi:hypothetical protein